jgi:hypothetical protein
VSEREIGYVVVEFNQVGGSPLVREDVWYDREDAQDLVDQNTRDNRALGRRDRYAVGTVTIEEED